MPIPFILGGAAAVAGAVGVKKGVDAATKSIEANRISKDAKSLLSSGQSQINNNRYEVNEALEKLGDGKVKLVKQLERYVRLMNQIRNIDLEEIDLSTSEIANEEAFHQLETYTIKLTNLLAGVSLSAGSGVLTAFGAYSGAMTFGAASTGAAIKGLTGVAATNATLAYLGGGSLAAGGYGMAGGTVILGGLVAGPAVAVGGFALDAMADKQLETSKSEAEKAKSLHKQQQLLAVALENIHMVTNSFNKLLLDVRKLQLKSDKALKAIIQEKTDWTLFTKYEKETVHTTLLVAQLVKGLLETNVLDESGELVTETNEKLSEIESRTDEYRVKFQ